jgi:hypothetical protein
VPQVARGQARELTLLIAREDPRRHPRVAARWLRRYLDESLDVTIDEARDGRREPRRPDGPGARDRGRDPFEPWRKERLGEPELAA